MNATNNRRRVAVVTGGAMGLGRAICKRMAEDGYDVAVADIAATDEVENVVQAAGGTVFASRCDISAPDEVARFAREVDEQLGAVDVLVANAGLFPIKPFLETTWAEWRKVMGVNLDSLYLLLSAFLPGMTERRRGRVVAIASGTFYAGTPLMGLYTATKGGVIGLVRSLAPELGDLGVTINAIAPSLMSTPGTEAGPQREMGWFEAIAQAQSIKRSAAPEDVVGTVAFLASSDAAFITGQTIPVDGGLVRV